MYYQKDDLENYFGRQRAIGRRKDNPSDRDVGYNDNTIKSQFSVRLLLVMFKVQLENLTKLITPHYQREENDYLKMIFPSQSSMRFNVTFR